MYKKQLCVDMSIKQDNRRPLTNIDISVCRVMGNFVNLLLSTIKVKNIVVFRLSSDKLFFNNKKVR